MAPKHFFLRSAVTQDDAKMGTDETDLENETRINTVSVIDQSDAVATDIDLDTTVRRGSGVVKYVVTMDADADLTEDARADTDRMNLFSGINSTVTTIELHGSEGQLAGQLDALIDDLANGGATAPHPGRLLLTIETERVEVVSVDTSGSKTVITVIRGADGTTAAAHDTETLVDSTTETNALTASVDTGDLNNTTDPVTFGVVDASVFAGLLEDGTAGALILKVESEEMKVTDITANNITVTRAHGGTSAATHAATPTVTQWFDTTTIEFTVDSAAVTVLNVGDYIRFAASAERMKITAVDLTNNFITVTRAVEGSAADVAANAQLDIAYNLAVTSYISADTTVFGVDDATNFAVGRIYKIATGGAERFMVTRIDETNELIEVVRGWEGTVAAVIADNADIWSVYGEEEFLAAIAAATGTANWVAERHAGAKIAT